MRTATGAGIPVHSHEHSVTIGPNGPILLQDHYLIEQMANYNRERISERQPHVKGGSAFAGGPTGSPAKTSTTTNVTCTTRSSAATIQAGRWHMQIMPFADAKDYRFNPFDLTKVWPHGSTRSSRSAG